MTLESVREFTQGFFTALGVLWTVREAIPALLRRLIDRYDKRPSELEES